MTQPIVTAMEWMLEAAILRELRLANQHMAELVEQGKRRTTDPEAQADDASDAITQAGIIRRQTKAEERYQFLRQLQANPDMSCGDLAVHLKSEWGL